MRFCGFFGSVTWVTAMGFVLLAPALLYPDDRREDAIPDEIVVTAPAPDRTAAAAPGVLVIDVAQSRRDGDVSVADVLRGVPGVDVQQRGSAFEPSAVRFRGSESEQVLVLRDGRPVSDSRSSLVDMSRISLAGVERIEIIRGPATALYGVGGAAGAINLISRDAPGSGGVPSSSIEISGSSRVTWGSFGEYHLEGGTRVSGLGSSGESSLDAAVAGVFATNTYAYVRAGESQNRENAGGGDGSVRVSVERVLPNERFSRVVFDSSAHVYRRGLPGSVEFPAVSAQLQEQRGALTAALHGADPASLWSISADMGLSFSQREFRDPDYPLGALANDSALTAVHGSVTPAGPVGPVVLSVPLSLHVELLSDSSLGERQRVVPAVAPTMRAAFDVPDGSVATVGVHSRVELVDEESLVSVRGTAAWTAATTPLRVALAGGWGYRMPDFADLFTERSAFTVGNPDLKPERSRSGEIEVLLGALARSTTVADGITGRVAVHGTQYEDLIQWLPDPNGVWRPRNTGEATVLGVEGTLEAHTSLGVSPWRAGGSVGGDLLHARDRTAGVTFDTQLPWRAALAFRGGGSLDHRLGHQLRMDVTGRGARPVTRQNTVWLDPYIRMDVTARVAVVPERVQVGAAVRNLLDQQFVETPFYPNPGREFRMSVEVQW